MEAAVKAALTAARDCSSPKKKKKKSKSLTTTTKRRGRGRPRKYPVSSSSSSSSSSNTLTSTTTTTKRRSDDDGSKCSNTSDDGDDHDAMVKKTQKMTTTKKNEKTTRKWERVGKHKYLGTRILREFEGFDQMFWATISAFSPAQPTDTDDPEDDLCRSLWHVVHDDGDEEDLEEHEIKEAIRITERVQSKTKEKKRRRRGVFLDKKKNKNGSKDLVERRVSVFWEAEKKWFQGVVDDWDEKDSTALVRYDDGEQSWHDLKEFKWKLCSGSSGSGGKKKKCKSGADLIGSKVVVFWDRPRGKGWFSGIIREYNTASERHRVVYDDKTSQWHDLKFCRWTFKTRTNSR